MQDEQKSRRRRVRTENPGDLDSADTFFTSVPRPIGECIRTLAAAKRKSHSAIIRDALVEKFGATASP